MNIDLVMKEHHIPQNKDTPLYALYKREKRRKKVILSVRFSCDNFYTNQCLYPAPTPTVTQIGKSKNTSFSYNWFSVTIFQVGSIALSGIKLNWRLTSWSHSPILKDVPLISSTSRRMLCWVSSTLIYTINSMQDTLLVFDVYKWLLCCYPFL